MTTPEEERAFGRALKTIGDELAAPDPDTTRARTGVVPARRWRSVRVLAGGIAATVALGAFAFSLSTPDQVDGEADGSRSLTDVQWVACSAGIGIGQITRIGKGSIPEKVALTVSVRRWLKPPEQPKTVPTFETMSGAFTGDPGFVVGQTILFLLQDISTEPAEVFRTGTARHPSAADIEEIVKQQLPRAATTECPAFWRNRNRDSTPGRDDG